MILPFAYNGAAMRWQAQSGFLFRVAGGYFSVIPHEYAVWPIVPALLEEAPYIPGYADQFKAFLAAHEARAIIVPETEYPLYAKLCATLGGMPLHLGGAVLVRLNSAALTPFASMTAAAMDTRYNLDRFAILICAARDFLVHGSSSRDLTPFAAERLGLLDATVAGEHLRPQTTGYPLINTLRKTRAFRTLAGYLISHGMVRERLAVELGPSAPGEAASTSGIWLGPWNGDSIAIGVLAGPPAAEAVTARFGSHADAIYYPYPLPYSRLASQAHQSADPQMLLMTFKTAALPALDVSTPPSP